MAGLKMTFEVEDLRKLVLIGASCSTKRTESKGGRVTDLARVDIHPNGKMRVESTNLDIGVSHEWVHDLELDRRITMVTDSTFFKEVLRRMGAAAKKKSKGEGVARLDMEIDRKATNRSPYGTIKLSINGDSSAKCQLVTEDPQQFYTLPSPIVDGSWAVKPRMIQRALEATTFAAARDEADRAYMGVWMRVVDGYLEATSTDRFQMATWRMPIEDVAHEGSEVPDWVESGFILDIDAAERLRQLAINHELPMVMGRAERDAMFFMHNGWTLFPRSLAIDHPDFGGFADIDAGAWIEFERREADRVWSLGSVFVAKKNPVCKLMWDEGVLAVGISNPEIGEALIPIDAEFEGSRGDVLINFRALSRACNAVEIDPLKEERIRVGIFSDNRAIIIESTGPVSQRVVLRPMSMGV